MISLVDKVGPSWHAARMEITRPWIHHDEYWKLSKYQEGHSRIFIFTLCSWPHPILPRHGKCIVQLFLHVADAYLASR